MLTNSISVMLTEMAVLHIYLDVIWMFVHNESNSTHFALANMANPAKNYKPINECQQVKHR